MIQAPMIPEHDALADQHDPAVEQQPDERWDQQDRELAGDVRVEVHRLDEHAEAALGADDRSRPVSA
jgi:hypothetical protein